MKRFYIIIAIVSFVVFSFLIFRTYEKEIFGFNQISSKEYDGNNVEIKRDKYNLRNFEWSGIFPLYGGFISDPHFLYSESVDVTGYLSSVFHDKSVRYQLIDVNPFFNNKTSENILAMEIEGFPYEYRLRVPEDSYLSTLQHDEPMSVFLYNEDTLYFVLQYGFSEGEFLIYEVGSPFAEDKELNYHLIDIKESRILESLDFPLSPDQIDKLITHTYSSFYQLYTQYLNPDYAMNQVESQKDSRIHLPVYYGANLNINRNEMKGIRNEEFNLRVQNRYEFITSSQNVEIANSPDTEKMVIKSLHSNYYDFSFLGDSFESSEFSIRNETKLVLIDRDYRDRLLSYIDQYKKLRKNETKTTSYFTEETPFRVEIITQFNDEMTIDRSVLSALIFPNTFPQTRKSMNSTEYALPNNAFEHLFILDFNDGYSLKLSYTEVQKLEDYLREIK
ncbi:hypothetical protein [Paenibacillus sp. IHBB 3054]|uniref:hypothetical protein n=1 Tax=Paenibacillus sp. IHBB 3054 TaxID=3425689 RepID=UPI003F66BA27